MPLTTAVPYMKRPFLYAALMLLTQCSRCKTDDPRPTTELEKLPPATQTGAGTFGCLVNGQAFTPRGDGLSPHFIVSYDRSFAGGALQVRAYRYPDSGGQRQHILFGGGGVNAAGTYPLEPAIGRTAFFSDWSRPAPCDGYDANNPITPASCRGSFTVTRLDLTARVVAGTFEFTLAKPGCDTIKVAHGRFDYPL